MSDEEVEASKDELSQPLDTDDDVENTDNFSEEETDEEDGISDDEFADYLGTDDEETDTEFDADEEDSEFDETDSEDDEEDEETENPAFDDDEEDDEEQFAEVNLDNNEDDDDIFEPENTEEGESDESDELTDETPENVISSETSEEDEEQGEDGDAATDVFGGNVNDPLGNNTEIAELPGNTPKTQEDENAEAYQPKFSYKIADVMFDENVKENKKEKSGSVIVIVPMIDGTGKKYVENKTIEFYLDDSNAPVLDNEPMTNELYAAVIDAIKNHPDYAEICDTAEPANEQIGPTIAALKADEDEDEDWEAEYLRNGNEEDRGEYGLGSNEEDDEWD